MSWRSSEKWVLILKASGFFVMRHEGPQIWILDTSWGKPSTPLGCRVLEPSRYGSLKHIEAHMVIIAYSPRSSVRLSLSLLRQGTKSTAYMMQCWSCFKPAWLEAYAFCLEKELPRMFLHGQASVKNFCLVGSLCLRMLIMKSAHHKYLFNYMSY